MTTATRTEMDPGLWELAEGVGAPEVAALARLAPGLPAPPAMRVVARIGDIASVRLPRARIAELRRAPGVLSLKAPRPIASHERGKIERRGPLARQSTPRVRSLVGASEARDERGAGCVVAVLDWGLDLLHPNFRRPDGGTRLLALWDQRAPRRAAAPTSPNPYGRGRVFDRRTLDAALQTADPFAALDLDPRRVAPRGGSHGTHVLDIAAGRPVVGPGGVAPGAELVFVEMGPSNTAGVYNFGDELAVFEAVHFAIAAAGSRPLVINMSMGRQAGPHDARTLVEMALDAAVRSRPGLVIVNSAGNYADAAAHGSGRFEPGELGARRELTWTLRPGDATGDELELWYPGADRLRVQLVDPHGHVHGPWRLGERGAIVDPRRHGLARTVWGRAYHRADDPNNGDHLFNLFLDPQAPAGPWTLELEAEHIVDGRYHAWIERDAGGAEQQSRFVPEDVDRRGTTGTIANGHATLAVGAWDPKTGAPATFSSGGPTRDGRQKPELLAPGVDQLAAASFTGGAAPRLTRKSGTSMAAPHVAGTVALLLARAPHLDVETVRALLRRSARPVPGPRAFVGWGLVDPAAALDALDDLLQPNDRAQAQESTMNLPLPPSTLAHGRAQSTAAAERRLLAAALAEGKRDPSALSSLIFHHRHPERQGARIKKGERALIKEWLAIREELVWPTVAARLPYSPTRVDPAQLAAQPSPVRAAKKPTKRCVDESDDECPALPDMIAVRGVQGVPFEYVWHIEAESTPRLDPGTGLRFYTAHQALRRQRFVPPTHEAVRAFVRNMRRFGMPIDAILTGGSYVCRCIGGTSRMSEHARGEAFDLVGVRWGQGAPAGRLRETIVRDPNLSDANERRLLVRINACLRLSFDRVIDYSRSDHRDHFHGDMNRGRGRTHDSTTFRFVQEVLGLRQTGKHDRPTNEALARFAGVEGSALRGDGERLDAALEALFSHVASGGVLGQAALSVGQTMLQLASPAPLPFLPFVPGIGSTGSAEARASSGLDAESAQWAQLILARADGAGIVADGRFGERSREALRRFQARAGLEDHGRVDAPTRTALVQAGLGYLAPGTEFAPTGTLDARTRDALLRFQADEGLDTSARFDAATRAKMLEGLREDWPWLAAQDRRLPGLPELDGPRVPAGFRTDSKSRGLVRRSAHRFDRTVLAMRRAGLTTITDAEIDTLQRVANIETSGRMQTLNTWDNAVVSIGFMQWTLRHGKIQEWIRLAPTAFARHGIELDPALRYRWKVEAIRGAPDPEVLRWGGWGERFYLAGLERGAVIAELALAREVLGRQLKGLAYRLRERGVAASETARFRNHYDASAVIRGMFQASYNNRPGSATAAVAHALRRSSASDDAAAFQAHLAAGIQASFKDSSGTNLTTKTLHGARL
ncbi:S8 family serine peptidase [Plesiocystis pacifica]|nr:S8 family serine peptidase [Plesiocystis pacifica]